jgi:hypothetical protein
MPIWQSVNVHASLSLDQRLKILARNSGMRNLKSLVRFRIHILASTTLEHSVAHSALPHIWISFHCAVWYYGEGDRHYIPFPVRKLE